MSDNQLAILKGNLSRNVKAGRKAIGLSQEELAFEAGIDRTYVSQIERAVCKNPSLEVLVRVSEVLGKTVNELLSK
jgi:transcriptional regulator with XRE-family HTH domain